MNATLAIVAVLVVVLGLPAAVMWFNSRTARLKRIARHAEAAARKKALQFEPAIVESKICGIPERLVYWYIFRTEIDLGAARGSELTRRLEDWTREALAAQNYPPEATIAVYFASDREIKAAGGPRAFFEDP